MMRSTVQKITPQRPSTFDQQFWPVFVALTVLSGIAIGAIVTILRGPWMWGSLLVLPVLATFAILLLFSLDNNRLRRSLQFAIITSLALHLLIMVFASVVNIFHNPYSPHKRQIAERPVRTIEISDHRAAFVWEETNARETPEPDVEPEKQTKPTTATKVQPQPVPVVESKPEIDPQLVRRETTSQTVPRQNRELSQRRRQTTRSLQPQTSKQMTGKQAAENSSSPAKSPSESKIESSRQADSVARQSASEQNPAAESGASSATPESTSQPIARTATSSRKSRPVETPQPSAPQPSPSKARIARRTPKIPIATRQSPKTETIAKATTPQPAPNEPSKSASELTRRPVQNRTNRLSFTSQPKTELSPRPQIAKTVERRTTPQTTPSITNPTSKTATPRRSSTESLVASSPVQIEKPDRAPESKNVSRELNSKTLSISRSTQGIAGVGSANNLERFQGGVKSPASRSSDSARRERTMSSATDQPMLTSSQKSVVRRSVGTTRIPSSAFQADTSAAAKIAGSQTPGEQTLESSAASVNAASTSLRDEFSAEKGNTAVDLGATKIVTEARQSERRSGGGQTEVAQLNPESTRRSKDRSNQQPSLVASTKTNVSAPRNQSAASPSTEALEAATQSAFAARTGGAAESTVERWSSESAGEIADAGPSNVAQQLSDSRARASRHEQESNLSENEDDDDEENNRGTQRTRVAQAPVTRSETGFGSAAEGTPTIAATNQASDAPSESMGTIVSRQAGTALQGSGIGRTATNVLMQAATSLPIIESSPAGRRSGSSNSEQTDVPMGEGLAKNSKSRGTRSTPANVTPTLSGDSGSVAPAAISSGSSNDTRLDSQPVAISRSEASAGDQVQGSELDIDAIEGPAGLGIRPATSAGVMTRPSARDSQQIQPDLNHRFRSKKFGGTPSINPDAVIAQEAFRNRSPSALATAAEPTTEAAIHLGLEFLARYQSADGSWSLSGFDQDATQKMSQLESDTAATGLALLAFQGAGYNHREFKYARQINLAIEWLLDHQSEDGGLYVSSSQKSDNACRLYSHGIAALALTEAYGMTQDARLKEPAQKALDYINQSQDPTKGGWRYFDQPGKKSTDTSVSGWMMMAMQSGRLAGLDVDEESFASIGDWLDVAADPDNSGLYRYNPYAVDSKGVSRVQGRKPTVSMTSVGLLMRIYSGWERDDPRLVAGAEFLLNNQLPSDTTPQLRDTYYWYYATQVLKHIDGPLWERWNDQLRPLLTRSQEKSGEMAGSWHPYRPVPDRWGAFGGRLYVTTMNLLSLEVRHRMLPLYQQSPPEDESKIDSGDANSPSNRETDSQPVSTTATQMPRDPRKRRPMVIAESIQVAEVEPPQPAMSTDKTPESKTVDVFQPIAIQPTVVQKPVVRPPQPSPALPPTVMTTQTPRDTRTAMKTPGSKAMPEINLGSLEPTRSRAAVMPASPPLVVPKFVASSPDPAQPRPLDSNRPNANVAPQLLSKTIPDYAPLVAEKRELRKTPAEQPRIAIPKTARRDANSSPRKNLRPQLTPPPKQSGSLVSISGTVTMDGQILKNASVELIPLEVQGERIHTRTDKQGRFAIMASGTNRNPGVQPGTYKVSITSYFESEDENVIDLLETVPVRFNKQTTLMATVTRDQPNVLSFEVFSK